MRRREEDQGMSLFEAAGQAARRGAVIAVDVLADSESAASDDLPFPDNIADNGDMLDAWKEYQEDGLWNGETLRGIGPLAADELRAWGATI